MGASNIWRRMAGWFGRDSGWSYMEMTVVVVVVGTIGSIAAVKMLNTREADVSAAVGQIFIGDLAFAQNLAMSTNKSVVFNFSAGSDDGEGEGDDESCDNHEHGHDCHGSGENHHDEDDDGCGENNHAHNCRGHGNGHNEDVRGEGMNGRGRGHGYGYGHSHGCGEGCGEHDDDDVEGGGSGAGGYGMVFADGSEVPFPPAALTPIDAPVTITPEVMTFRFDSVGRLVVTGHTWAAGETSITLFTINDKYAVSVTRETGKAKLVKL